MTNRTRYTQSHLSNHLWLFAESTDAIAPTTNAAETIKAVVVNPVKAGAATAGKGWAITGLAIAAETKSVAIIFFIIKLLECL